MLPLVLNDVPSRLIQITMSGSVGQNGKNIPTDVRLIQAMLNQVPVREGGPSTKLLTDGIAGAKTIAAITQVQQAMNRTADGRIDPAGPTLVSLGRLLNNRGLLPRVPGLGSPDGQIQKALTGAAGTPAVRHPGATNGFFPNGPTDWKFRSSSGVSLGAGVAGIAAMKFYLEKDSRPGFIRIFPCVSIGAGLSMMPVGLDISFADFPSYGLRIKQGVFNGQNPMPEDNFQGPCQVYSVGVSLGVGWSGTLVLFGAVGPFIPSTHAIGVITGMEVGIPGASLTGFWGVVGRAEN